jgi:hypothetical protein
MCEQLAEGCRHDLGGPAQAAVAGARGAEQHQHQHQHTSIPANQQTRNRISHRPAQQHTWPYHSSICGEPRPLALRGMSARTSGVRMVVIISHSAWCTCMRVHGGQGGAAGGMLSRCATGGRGRAAGWSARVAPHSKAQQSVAQWPGSSRRCRPAAPRHHSHSPRSTPQAAAAPALASTSGESTQPSNLPPPRLPPPPPCVRSPPGPHLALLHRGHVHQRVHLAQEARGGLHAAVGVKRERHVPAAGGGGGERQAQLRAPQRGEGRGTCQREASARPQRATAGHSGPQRASAGHSRPLHWPLQATAPLLGPGTPPGGPCISSSISSPAGGAPHAAAQLEHLGPEQRVVQARA